MVSFDEAFSQLQHRSTKYVISDSDIENVKRKKLEEYDRIFTEKGEGSVKEFLRVCRKWELIFEYGGL
jgi:hypothetical protein